MILAYHINLVQINLLKNLMNAQARRENGIELRRTHFSFGNDGKQFYLT